MSAETKYRQFTDNDNDLWARLNSSTGQVDILGRIRYRRGSAMANEIERLGAIGAILKENGININMALRFGVPEDYSPDDSWFSFSPQDSASLDGSIYKYFVMPDEGRGWGVFLKKTPDDQIVLIAHDHIDNMTEVLFNFAKEKGIDLETKHTYAEGIEDLGSFEPSPKDF